jgi:hypothetical protein
LWKRVKETERPRPEKETMGSWENKFPVERLREEKGERG